MATFRQEDREAKGMMLRARIARDATILVMAVFGSRLAGCSNQAPSDPFSEAAAAARANEAVDALPLGIDEFTEAALPEDGPEGALFGVRLANGHGYYLLGTMAGDAAVLSGAVLEDVEDRIVLLQERTSGGHRLTFSTGDSVEIEAQGDVTRYTWSFRATDPASVVVLQVDENLNVTIDEARTSIETGLRTTYGPAGVRLPRAAAGKRIPMAQTGPACPGLGNLFDAAELACIVGQYSPAQVSRAAVQQMCVALGLFLDSVRGSAIFMGQEQELAPGIIARMKFGLTIACALLDHLATIGQAADTVGAAVGVICNLMELVKEGARIHAPDGRSLQQQICDQLYPDESEPVVCENSCTFSRDGACDDGREGAASSLCVSGTDCADCGPVGMPLQDDPACVSNWDCSAACPRPRVDPDCTRADLCVIFEECCPDDGRCDVLGCPATEPDPDCSATELCAGLGICCPGDGVCDLASCPTDELDADCTNVDLCLRRQQCCDDDRCDSGPASCPEADVDCAFCGVVDGVCIAGCDPADADCAAGRWVRVGSARVNPEQAETEFISASNPGDLDEIRYSLGSTSISSTNRKVDNDVELWNVALQSSFNEPPAMLTPGETIRIDIHFSSSGSVTNGFHPSMIFQVGGLGVGITPATTFTYDPFHEFFDGVSDTSYRFVVPPVRDGQISVSAFWWNCEACVVTWDYERE